MIGQGGVKKTRQCGTEEGKNEIYLVHLLSCQVLLANWREGKGVSNPGREFFPWSEHCLNS